MPGVRVKLGWYTRAGARNSRFQTRTACMLVLDLDYSPQCVRIAHAHQVRDLHSMVGRGAGTHTFRVRIRVRVRGDMTFTVIVMKVMVLTK